MTNTSAACAASSVQYLRGGSAAIVVLNGGKIEAVNSGIGVKIAADGTPTIIAVDGKDDTAAYCEYQAADFGRPIRVDKVRLVTTGSAGHPVQGSNDGWNYETIVARETSDPLTVEYKFAEPKVYRYFRIFYEKEPQTPAINEVTFYTEENAPYVAVDDETEIARTTSGIRLAGKVFAGGEPAPEQITLRAWVADRDYGTDEAAWTAAGVEPVELGAFAAGADYSVGPIPGAAGKVNFVRLQKQRTYIPVCHNSP